MNEAITQLTVDKLKKLPIRAIVALAARCARRVEPLAQLPEGHPTREIRRQAVEAALGMADRFAKGEPCPHPDPIVRAADVSRRAAGGGDRSALAAGAVAETAHAVAAACLAYDPAEPGRIRHVYDESDEVRKVHGRGRQAMLDLAALSAFTAAADGVAAVGLHYETYVSAALNDYEKLLRLDLGEYPDLGEPVDPSTQGPLGPLGST
jgi:hypothetical protein